MQQRFGINLEVTCNKKEVLDTVKQNREEHIKIVQEAKIGYVEKARALLEEKLHLLKEGKVGRILIDLQYPLDHTSEYDTIIKMLTLHIGDDIILGANEVQMFVEDKWDWTDQFLHHNSAYSGTARSKL